jgi:hypothetical protein
MFSKGKFGHGGQEEQEIEKVIVRSSPKTCITTDYFCSPVYNFFFLCFLL